MAQEAVPDISDLLVRIAVLEERLKAMGEALRLQAKEYERRLLDLNHAHEKQVEDQRTYVSLDKYEGFEEKMNSWQSTMQIKFASMESAGLGKEKGGETLVKILLLVAGAVIAWIATKLGATP